jgi:hypothetical protein
VFICPGDSVILKRPDPSSRRREKDAGAGKGTKMKFRVIQSPKLNLLFGEGAGMSARGECLEHPKVAAKDVIDGIGAFGREGTNS